MKVAVTGANGQLGKDLVGILRSRGFDVYGFGRDELDICNLDQCQQVLTRTRPEVIIHSAAYTAVDQAESDQDRAYEVNAFGTRNIAVCANEIGAKLVYISTDYVFDGTGQVPYKEFDSTNPNGVYGKSKHAGELLTRSLCHKFFIVRTSWVYGLHGNNFIKTMLKLGKERDSLKVVNDQIGSPTYTVDLSHFLVELIQTEKYGIYHASNSGVCSWFDFAKAIFDESGLEIKVEPCTTDEFPRPAPRPKYSAMDHMAIRLNGFADIPPWRDALKRFLEQLQHLDA
ncbi:dTDP-4-dehydrorhamnose reductase [Paenibacillus contaminans]|uniref:dTDP-4-dehydrorhamnose reductase n=1 Tax=Paenibacillus contaminans TaxID=450362 RepID=A0A329M0W6_9BACL|nr:dTDP-4-dehydrorhamnose reductase [Paenibacillus contaminans]RAV13779.1 dTDP-4-dehydrorhamnose reductase [Paenibacillus contaminans]